MSGAALNVPLPGVIVAAGGLVWRQSGAAPEILLVRRTRYFENEWTLPKGKAKRGETWLETARREVAEEAECAVEIGVFAGCNCYPSAGMPKIVLLWNMRFVADLPPAPQEEVVERLWLPAADAVLRLSHSPEKAIVQVNAALGVSHVPP